MALVSDLGQLSYSAAHQIQLKVADRVKRDEIPHTLLFVEHDPVLTLGANFHEDNLRLSLAEYAARGIDVVRTDRGGDVTYHGPNQLVIYPIFDVARLGKDLHKWLRDLEEVIILVLGEFGIAGSRFPPNTGVWVSSAGAPPAKIAAIGIKVSRWVSMHGIALNCDNDLSPFDLIVPCGIRDYAVTSLSLEAGREITIEDTKPMVRRAFESVFSLTFEKVALSELMDETGQAAPPQALS